MADGRPEIDPNSVAGIAATQFNAAVDHLTMKELVKGIDPASLAGLVGVTRTGDEQVAARSVGDMSQDTSRKI